MAIDPDFWRGRRVLVTGHTGFKGAWLALWLHTLGAELTGVARGPAPDGSLYAVAGAGNGVAELNADVCDGDALSAAVAHARPEVIVHLAGQPFLRRSLRDPVATYEVNVMGTVNVLEAVRAAGPEVRALVIVTSDKCYENTPGRRRPFAEHDPLGGSDPYSSSKACAELVVSAFARSFGALGAEARIATARAGNVIGGGDRGEDRLLPDAVRAVQSGRPLRVRNVASVRPWQHVLSPLAGYLLLAQRLWQDDDAARPWNFGPPARDARPAGWIAARLAELWEGELEWVTDDAPNPPEAPHLLLDSTAAERDLGWRAPWGLDEALARTVDWHRRARAGADMRRESLAQIAAFSTALDG